MISISIANSQESTLSESDKISLPKRSSQFVLYVYLSLAGKKKLEKKQDLIEFQPMKTMLFASTSDQSMVSHKNKRNKK